MDSDSSLSDDAAADAEGVIENSPEDEEQSSSHLSCSSQQLQQHPHHHHYQHHVPVSSQTATGASGLQQHRRSGSTECPSNTMTSVTLSSEGLQPGLQSHSPLNASPPAPDSLIHQAVASSFSPPVMSQASVLRHHHQQQGSPNEKSGEQQLHPQIHHLSSEQSDSLSFSSISSCATGTNSSHQTPHVSNKHHAGGQETGSSRVQESSMWLGTEDGCIHIYNCGDNIRIKKHKMRVQLSASVNSIVYLDEKVYVGLGNGQLVTFHWDCESGAWMMSEPTIFELAASPILKLLPMNHKLWCAVQNHIKIFNSRSCEIEISFHVSLDSSRVIHTIVSCGLGVWVSTQSSPIIRLYHAVTYECLLDVNVAPAVSKILSGRIKRNKISYLALKFFPPQAVMTSFVNIRLPVCVSRLFSHVKTCCG